ncbi:serine/threonine protein kinase [Streptomyces sp. MT29]|nr:serine/threonine protein kinase [Streptomyces sp. MT29]
MAGYRLLARIGEGGMGRVYLSRTRGNQPVALKVIRREYAQDQEFRRRFEQEATSARRVQGYYIVPVVDHDTTGPQPWLATTYVPGLALDQLLTGHGTLPLSTVLQLTGCAAEALHAVHKAGVIHRDMKPSNILIGSEGPWIIDFGIARAADATQLTRSGGLIGTPQFMSPEHADGQDLTPATDVFSLGLIAAVAATGRHPYGEAGAITLAAKIANSESRPPDLTAYPQPLRAVLERTLAADATARPTPSELAELCQELNGRPLRDFVGWLPAPVATDIARREQISRQQAETDSGPPSGAVAGAETVPPPPVASGAAVPTGAAAAVGPPPPVGVASGGYTPTHASRPGEDHGRLQPSAGSSVPFPPGAPPPTGPPAAGAYALTVARPCWPWRWRRPPSGASPRATTRTTPGAAAVNRPRRRPPVPRPPGVPRRVPAHRPPGTRRRTATRRSSRTSRSPCAPSSPPTASLTPTSTWTNRRSTRTPSARGRETSCSTRSSAAPTPCAF